MYPTPKKRQQCLCRRMHWVTTCSNAEVCLKATSSCLYWGQPFGRQLFHLARGAVNVRSLWNVLGRLFIFVLPLDHSLSRSIVWGRRWMNE
ncbi:hypothetical protein NPIL_256651 [Nephila pilipes]|uniref:Uncharacterized protein n=1 Tax=Nephila pilipes TaxID=299642 RepID=A0A8X6QIW7_NEPPI|nr:hypothetical protein NPIL_256651 [Nephila pilipes]